MKYSFQLPRPFGIGDGFPSGNSATAFALAVAAGTAYPVTAPMLHFLPYWQRSRAFMSALIGGALLGAACGYGSGAEEDSTT